MVSADPTSTVEFEVEAKALGKPIKVRARYMTRRDVRRHGEIIERIRATETEAEADALMNEALAIGVVGVSTDLMTVGLAPTVAGLEHFLTTQELIRLVIDYPRQVRLMEIDLGKSSSPPASAAATSAASADADPAKTETSPG